MTITRLTTGSSHCQFVQVMIKPAMTTPSETAASAAICRKAPRMFISPLRPDINKSAVAVLIAIPTAATHMTVLPMIGTGELNRWIASQAITPIALSRNMALKRAARIEERRNP
ncbi:hypothetical protein D3C72_2144220 [compost metagenome]